MIPYDVPAIAAELNERAISYSIGQLQDLRKDLKGFARRPGSQLFSGQTIHADWAFHHGGRAELQFNIGKDPDDGRSIRYGVAFSFETSQTLPNIDALKPKARLFGEFLQLHPDEFADMRLWHWDRSQRSDESMPGLLNQDVARNGVFVFFGKQRPASDLTYEEILNTFDRLLPLYKHVESDGRLPPVIGPMGSAFRFVPGCPSKLAATKAFVSDRNLDVALRHNQIQEALYQVLSGECGSDNVGVEIESGNGTRIDVVVRRGAELTFYEIKTAHSPRACIREAIGQLLEYAYWPGSQKATRLVVVGESPIDADAVQYLERLRVEFSVPL